MTARNWICTRNNPELEGEEYLKMFHELTEAVYTVGQLEQGKKEETLHLLFFCNFKEPVRITHLRKVDNKAHYEKVKKNNGADLYCMKEDTRVQGPWEFGTKPLLRNSKTDWKKIRQLAEENKMEDIDDDIFIRYQFSLCKIAKDNLTPFDKPDVRGLWIWGDAGVGKSRYARERLKCDSKDIYFKQLNKWWDSYRKQKHVIMDDIDPRHDGMGHLLKIWMDRYGFYLEVKGGIAIDYHETFTVTSQYEIEEIWPNDPKTCEAIRRRCKVLHMTGFAKSKLRVIDASYNY